MDEVEFRDDETSGGANAGGSDEAGGGSVEGGSVEGGSAEGGSVEGGSAEGGSVEGGSVEGTGGHGGVPQLEGGAGGEPGEGVAGYAGEESGVIAGPLLADDLTYFRTKDGRDALLTRTADGHLYLFRRANEWTLLNLTTLGGDVTGVATGSPRAYLREDAYDTVVYRRSDGGVVELRQVDESWLVTNISGDHGAPHAKGSPAPYLRSDGTNSVLYRAFDDNVYELYTENGTWLFANYGFSFKTPTAAGDPRPFIRADDVNAMVYRTTDHRLSEIYCDKSRGGEWITVELSPPNATAAAGFPDPYVRSDNRNAVVYRGEDGHIYELSSAATAHNWSALDLSAIASAPEADSDPAGYVRAEGSDAVVYRASDQQVYELRRSGHQWFVADVSAAAGAPAAASRPTPYVRSDGVTAIAYRGHDDRLYELSWIGSTWHKVVIYAGATAAP